MRHASALLLCAATASFSAACHTRESKGNPRVSGQIEATEVQVSPEIGGRILDVAVAEGNRLKKGDVVARLDTRDIDLAIQRAQADRAGADAQLRLVQAGSRVEDIRQADAQAAAAAAEVAAAQADLAAAETDLRRFETLLESNSGSRKQRDDAATRRDVARDRLASARARENAAREAAAKLRAGARREEIDAARARVAAVDAQIASLEKNKADATVVAPMDGFVKDYVNTGKIKYVLRDFPIQTLHPGARKSHEAAHCAGEQGKYWQMHDRLFGNIRGQQIQDLTAHAKALRLDGREFEQCLASERHTARVHQALEEGQRAGVRGTPTFFVGIDEEGRIVKATRMLRGAQSYEQFKAAIDAVLADIR